MKWSLDLEELGRGECLQLAYLLSWPTQWVCLQGMLADIGVWDNG